MGFFKKSTPGVTEDEVMQMLSKQKILDDIMYTLGEELENNSWLVKCQSYYDDRERVVTVGPDLFEIKWRVIQEERDSQGKRYPVENILEKVAYSYTKSGYTPIPNYAHYSQQRVVEMWAKVVQESLNVKFEDCIMENKYIEKDKQRNNCFSFTYKVPEIEWKEWF